uniref:Ribosomal protein S10 n=1 Tax=Geranium maderense TaxID=28964 RepID=A0A0G2YL16_9ROSI|nr:ribosomal protein S10 [Geranium maderense]
MASSRTALSSLLRSAARLSDHRPSPAAYLLTRAAEYASAAKPDSPDYTPSNHSQPPGRQGAGRYTKEKEFSRNENSDSDFESEEAAEEKEMIFSEKQLAPLRVGRKGDLLPSHTGKVALPRTRSLYTVLRSPHVHKKSREQFETRVHRQLLFIKAEPHELQKKFFWLKRQCVIGAQHEVIVSYQTRLGDLKKILNNAGSSEKPKAVSPAR